MYYRLNNDGTVMDWSSGLKPYANDCLYSDKQVITAWNGSNYVEGSEPEKPQEILKHELQQQLTEAVQRVLDSKAQELNYDSCLSVCSYVETGVPKFDDEGRAFRAWRSAVWAKGYEIVAEVQAGEREIPTEDELWEMLPKLEINYSE